MPKTIEELEAEKVEQTATHKATIETNKGLYEGKLAAMQEQLDTATSHATDLSKDLKVFQDNEEVKRKATRTDNEAKAHAIKKDLDVKDWSDDRLVGYLDGNESVTSHSTQAPPAGAGTPSPGTFKTAADRLNSRWLTWVLLKPHRDRALP